AGVADEVLPSPRRKAGPALEGEAARDPGSAISSDRRCLDGDGAGPAERIAERLLAGVSRRQKQGCRQRLAQRRLRLGAAPPPLMQERAAGVDAHGADVVRSEEHTSELQSPDHLVCRLLLEKK